MCGRQVPIGKGSKSESNKDGSEKWYFDLINDHNRMTRIRGLQKIRYMMRTLLLYVGYVFAETGHFQTMLCLSYCFKIMVETKCENHVAFILSTMEQNRGCRSCSTLKLKKRVSLEVHISLRVIFN